MSLHVLSTASDCCVCVHSSHSGNVACPRQHDQVLNHLALVPSARVLVPWPVLGAWSRGSPWCRNAPSLIKRPLYTLYTTYCTFSIKSCIIGADTYCWIASSWIASSWINWLIVYFENFLSTTIFYYHPKISYFMMNLVWEYPNIKIHSKVCQINRLEIALTNHVLHLRYMNKYLVHNSIPMLCPLHHISVT